MNTDLTNANAGELDIASTPKAPAPVQLDPKLVNAEPASTFWAYLHKAEDTEAALNSIPTAYFGTITAEYDTGKPAGIYTTDKGNQKAIVINDEIVATVSSRYKLVQHREAFKPIIDGLHYVGVNYDMALIPQGKTKMGMNVFMDKVEAYEGNDFGNVHIGFRVVNSVDGRNAISYLATGSAKRGTTTIELVGYRQVCKNGMVVRVPLAEADYVTAEEVTKIQAAVAKFTYETRIFHVGDAKARIAEMQYVAEVVALLKAPMQRMLQKASTTALNSETAKKLIKGYIGKRLEDRILQQYDKEEKTLWGLYNAVTYVASHDVKGSTMNGLLKKSAIMLERELTARSD